MNRKEKIKNKGRLEIICGSMFSGKTEELLRRLRRAEYAKQNVLTVKHKIDIRRHEDSISSHSGQQRKALAIGNKEASINDILNVANDNVDVVGIDEIHFFPHEIIGIICDLVDQGKRVIVAGLDLDFRGVPFGIVPTLMSIADEVTKFKAICVVCGDNAHYTQRIVNGVPARYEDPTILVGAEESYEARCRDCFSINRGPNLQERLAQTESA